MPGSSFVRSEWLWLQAHWQTPKWWDFVQKQGSLAVLPIPSTSAEADLIFRADIPLANGSKDTRNRHWKSFASWFNGLYLPPSAIPIDVNLIARWIRLDHAGDASVKDLVSSVKCRGRQLSLLTDTASDEYLAQVLTKRVTKAYGSSKGVSKAPVLTRFMLRTIQENRLFKILDLWMNCSLRVSGWLSLDYEGIPSLQSLRSLYGSGQRFIELRVYSDKTNCYYHFLPIKPWIDALSGIPLILPVVQGDLDQIKNIFIRYKYAYQEHSPRRTWCIWVRRKLFDLLKLNTKVKIKKSIFLKRINTLVGWAPDSDEFFNYSEDFLSMRVDDLPTIREDIWQFIRLGNSASRIR